VEYDAEDDIYGWADLCHICLTLVCMQMECDMQIMPNLAGSFQISIPLEQY